MATRPPPDDRPRGRHGSALRRPVPGISWLLLAACLACVAARAHGTPEAFEACRASRACRSPADCPAFDDCPPPGTRSRIELLPITICGNTCDGFGDSLDQYAGGCGFPSTDRFDGNDALYPVRLNEGNENVAFRLEVSEGADLVLALLEDCDDGSSCVAASLDFIGSGDESIPPRRYEAGTYLLSVDSASDLLPECDSPSCCGAYTLTVTGTNPTPDLQLSLGASSDPEADQGIELDPETEVVAGRHLTYTMEVTNTGDLAASDVEVRLDLPTHATFVRASPGCRAVDGGEALCEIDRLGRGGVRTREVAVRVSPSVRGRLTAEATVVAAEGEPTPGDNTARIETAVRAVTDLGVDLDADPAAEVVAGRGLVYTASVTNRGPSEATEVVVTDVLPAQVVFPAELPDALDCPRSKGRTISCTPVSAGRLRCPVGRLAPDGSVALCVPVTVRPSARGELSNRVRVAGAAAEEDPVAADDEDRVTVTVLRRTDLEIAKVALTGSEPEGEVLVGRELRYRFSVTNRGPSTSSGARICDCLPAGLAPASLEDTGCDGTVCPDGTECDAAEGETALTCSVGPLDPGETGAVLLGIEVDPAVVASPFSNSATVTPLAEDELDEDGRNDGDGTEVRVEVDLSLRGCEEPGAGLVLLPSPVAAGGDLLHEIRLSNCGRSDSGPGTVRVDLPPELDFVRSFDGCKVSETDGQGTDGWTRIECGFDSVPGQARRTLRFVARVDPSVPGGSLAVGPARINANGHDSNPDNHMSEEAAATVVVEANLEVTQADDPDPVGVGEALTYSVTVTDRGPSDARDVVLCDCLPEGGVAPSFDGDCSLLGPGESCLDLDDSDCRNGVLECTLGRLAPGDSTARKVEVTAPSEPGVIENLARVSDRATGPETSTDPDPSNDQSVEPTTVAAEGDADLALTATRTTETVRAGDTARYELTVEHRGPDPEPRTVTLFVMPSEASDVSAILEGESCAGDTVSGSLACELHLPSPGERSLVITATVDPTVDSTAPEVPGTLSPIGSIEHQSTPTGDPNPFNDTVLLTTRVFDAPDLVLPWFETGTTPAEPTSLFAVRGSPRTQVEIGLEPEAPALPPVPLGDFTLGPWAVKGINLRDEALALDIAEPLTGSVGVRGPDRTDPGESGVLGGEHVQLEPGGRSGSGGLLVDTSSGRSPRELCRRWSVRFLNGGPAGATTELRFWVPEVPETPDGDPVPVVRGLVFTEAGDPIQEVTIPLVARAFVRDSTAPFDGGTLGANLLAAAGAIEWELPEGIAGNVSVVHRVPGTFAVEVPGTCLDRPFEPRQPGRDHPLVLPYFEVAPDGRTALLAVRNEGDEAIPVRFTVHSADGDPLLTETCPLAARAVRTVNLQDVDGSAGAGGGCDVHGDPEAPVGLTSGFVQVQAVLPDDGAPNGTGTDVFLSGDFILVSSNLGRAAGGALVDTDPSRRPPRLCSRWFNRLIHDGAGRTTDFLVYADEPENGGEGGSSLTGTVRDGRGIGLGAVHFDLRPADRVLRVGSREILERLREEGALSGTIEWSSDRDRRIHVSTRFQGADGFSILVPGICLDEAGTDDR